jgi:hypothetical protein
VDRREMKLQELGESCVMRIYMTALFAKYNWNRRVQKTLISRGCSTNGENWKRIGFGGKTRERYH